MSNAYKLEIVGAAAAVLFVALSVAAKQPGQAGFEAPVPAQILTARSIFISNQGKGCGPFEKEGFAGGPNRAYNEFYLAMKKWGHYRLASAPEHADLEFEIGFSCPSVGSNVTNGESVGSSIDPQFRLSILDIKTHMAIWGFTEHVKLPGASPLVLLPVAGPILLLTHSKKEAEKHLEANYEAAMARLVSDVKALTEGPLNQPSASP